MDKASTAYNKAKALADKTYGKKTSAYKSGYIVQQYKKFGGKYDAKKQSDKGLKSWFDKESWIDVEMYLKGKTKPCGDSKIALCRPLHGNYSIAKYDTKKIKDDLAILKSKKKDGKTINWAKYKK
jgi:hypothetical protein